MFDNLSLIILILTSTNIFFYRIKIANKLILFKIYIKKGKHVVNPARIPSITPAIKIVYT